MTRAPPWSSEPLRRKTEPHRRGSVGLLENPEWQMYDRREGRRINRGERKRRKGEEVSRQTEEGEEKQRCTWKRRINKSIHCCFTVRLFCSRCQQMEAGLTEKSRRTTHILTFGVSKIFLCFWKTCLMLTKAAVIRLKNQLSYVKYKHLI